MVEILESRIAPANIIVVTTLADNKDADDYTGGLEGSLNWAINQANQTPGSEIVFQVSPTKSTPLKGTITLAEPLPSIAADVTITAPGITINGAGKFQGLSITGGSNIALTGLTLTNCNAVKGAGLYINDPGASITITDAVFSHNHALGTSGAGNSVGKGGGLYINDAGGTITLSNSQIKNNEAVGKKTNGPHNAHGGGIFDAAGLLTIDHSSITGNSVTGTDGGTHQADGGLANGGGIFSEDALIITNSSITKNSVHAGNAGTGGYAGGQAVGGGIDCHAALTITSSVISGNTVHAGNGSGGDLYRNGGAGGGAYGGGVNDSGGVVTVANSTISGNAVIGGFGASGGKVPTVPNGISFSAYDGTISPPSAGYDGWNGTDGGSGGKGSGGGVHVTGDLTITASTISGNTATAGSGGKGGGGGKGGNGGHGGSHDGALYPAGNGGAGGSGGNGGDSGLAHAGGVLCDSALTIQNSTISGNSVHAGKPGAPGAAASGGSGTIHGAKGSPGSAGSDSASRAGGIESHEGTLDLSQVTVAKNSAGNGGGIWVYQDTSATIDNCTIALNKGSTGGGLFVVPDTNNDPINVVSTIITQNTAKMDGNVSGFTDDPSYHNLISPTLALGPLGFHDGGTTQTMLPPNSMLALYGPGLNPDNLQADQNGSPFPTDSSSILIGAVQTTA